jgi:hypothetical protein
MSPMGNDLLQRIAAEKLAIKRRDEKMYAMYQSGVGFSLIAREFEMSRQTQSIGFVVGNFLLQRSIALIRLN